MPKHKKSPTKKQAKKKVRATGKKPVVVSKRTIRKHGPGITTGEKVAFGKKKKPTDKGRVTNTIKYVAGIEKRKKERRKKQKIQSRPLI